MGPPLTGSAPSASHVNGHRVDNTDDKEVGNSALTSDAYRPGYVCARGTLDPGMVLYGTSTVEVFVSYICTSIYRLSFWCRPMCSVLCLVTGVLLYAVGVYTVIFSTWTAKTMTGPFAATFASSHPDFRVLEIPPEGHGRNYQAIKGSWTGSLAAGCNNFHNYTNNPLFKFEVVTKKSSEMTKIKLNARLMCINGTPFPLNLSLFPLQMSPDTQQFTVVKNVSPKRAIASSNTGVYVDNACGVTIPDTELTSSSADCSGYYGLIPSTFNPNECSDYIIHVYTTGHPGAIRFL